MRRFIIILLFISVNLSSLQAQHGGDSTSTKTALKPGVSKYGYYLNGGIVVNGKGVGGIGSFSLASNTTLYSLTCATSSSIYMLYGHNTFSTVYAGVLIGKALRGRYYLASFSGGLSVNSTSQMLYDPNSPPKYDYDKTTISIPIEGKLFLLAPNVAGIGLHLSLNVLPDMAYSTFYFGMCFMLGKWGTTKNRGFAVKGALKYHSDDVHLPFEKKSTSYKNSRVSAVGNYFFGGSGFSRDPTKKLNSGYNRIPAGYMGYTLAIRSHTIGFSYHQTENYVLTTSKYLLLGEAFRSRFLYGSVSTGIGWVENPQIHGVLSWPVEVKAFAHLSHIVGIGTIYATSITRNINNSNYYVGWSLVLGNWNKIPIEKLMAKIDFSSNSKDNTYFPLNCTENAKPKKTSSVVAVYVLTGQGLAYTNKGMNPAGNFGICLVYKSHAITVETINGWAGKFHESNHFLFGESIRSRNFSATLSTGLAFTTLESGTNSSLQAFSVNIPLELRTLLHFRNLFGFGTVFSVGLASPLAYANAYVGYNFVFGIWNKIPKSIKKPAIP